MQLHIVAVGNRLPAWAKLAWSDYAKRFPKSYALQLTEIPTPNRTTYAISEAKALEGAKMQRQLTHHQCVVALDERGERWNTKQLAQHLNDWQNQYKQVVFLIGGPDGLTTECLTSAHQRLSLSALTLPHVLARIVLIEQLYRSVSLLSNHPYHRE